ncbi:unnamed protein product [Vitrella brassicaformis CCMP3155]|uniref:Poly(A) RNA polymerase mitochondrial-like central palm domain-containing protein n=1 Tax=Vitrella brassicaformis (strain CCMP3155) TaxID=1169540 RepID=A0A0G4GIC2_VITBC|nr:unnamed protein product [Vitrella brassicaformis CCMP3155]|eukprot:CEM29616.1 unnamed protein product [Vitrella brassicaformis CCMP3155]
MEFNNPIPPRSPLTEYDSSRLTDDLISGFTSAVDGHPHVDVAHRLRNSIWSTTNLKDLHYHHLTRLADELSQQRAAFLSAYCDAVAECVLATLQAVAVPHMPAVFSTYEQRIACTRLVDYMLVQESVGGRQQQRTFLAAVRDLVKRGRLGYSCRTRLEQVEYFFNRNTSVFIPPSPVVDAHAPDPHDAQLWDRVDRLRPDKHQIHTWIRLFQNIVDVTTSTFGHPGLLYGSAVNGFATRESDLDVVVQLPPSRLSRLMDEARAEAASGAKDENPLRAADSFPSDKHDNWQWLKLPHAPTIQAVRVLSRALDQSVFQIECIENARVPIVKCTAIRRKTDADGRAYDEYDHPELTIDISFNHEVVLHNSRLLRAYAEHDSRAAALGLVVKHWAKCRGLVDPRRGAFSSYSWILLTIHFLQHHRQLTTGQPVLPNLQSPPAHVCPPPYPSVLVDPPQNNDVFYVHPTDGVNTPIFPTTEADYTDFPAPGSLAHRLLADPCEPLRRMERENNVLVRERGGSQSRGVNDLLSMLGMGGGQGQGQQQNPSDAPPARGSGVAGDSLLSLFYEFTVYFAYMFNYYRDVVSIKRPAGVAQHLTKRDYFSSGAPARTTSATSAASASDSVTAAETTPTEPAANEAPVSSEAPLSAADESEEPSTDAALPSPSNDETSADDRPYDDYQEEETEAREETECEADADTDQAAAAAIEGDAAIGEEEAAEEPTGEGEGEAEGEPEEEVEGGRALDHIFQRICMAIEDPLEKDRTLGLSFAAQERVSMELRRAAFLLSTRQPLDELFRRYRKQDDNQIKALLRNTDNPYRPTHHHHTHHHGGHPGPGGFGRPPPPPGAGAVHPSAYGAIQLHGRGQPNTAGAGHRLTVPGAGAGERNVATPQSRRRRQRKQRQDEAGTPQMDDQRWSSVPQILPPPHPPPSSRPPRLPFPHIPHATSAPAADHEHPMPFSQHQQQQDDRYDTYQQHTDASPTAARMQQAFNQFSSGGGRGGRSGRGRGGGRGRAYSFMEHDEDDSYFGEYYQDGRGGYGVGKRGFGHGYGHGGRARGGRRGRGPR